MPVYEFELPDGRVVEEVFPMEAAPEIGSEVVLPSLGLTARRIVSQAPRQTNITWEHVAYSLPRNHPDFKRVDSKGRGVFLNKKEASEFAARNPVWDTERKR